MRQERHNPPFAQASQSSHQPTAGAGNELRRRTKGDFIENDLGRLRQIVKDANDKFGQRHQAALDSQKRIALFLRGEFPKPEAEESAGA